MSEGKNKRQLNSALLVNLLKENIQKDEDVTVVVEQAMLCQDKVSPACSIWSNF